jgi:DnaJ-class molecular chaperone
MAQHPAPFSRKLNRAAPAPGTALGRPAREAHVESLARTFPPSARFVRSRLRAVEVELLLSRAEAETGAWVTLALPTFELCTECAAHGRAADPTHEREPGGPEGAGRPACDRCDGSGCVEGEEIVRIALPRGVGDGEFVAVRLSPIGVHGHAAAVRIRVASP